MEYNSKGIHNYEDQIVLSYLALLNHLSTDLKLKLIAKLSENIAFEVKKRPIENIPSWKSLFGVWSDTEDDLAEKVRASRFSERSVPSFDE